MFCYQIKIDQQLDFEDLSDLPDMEELSRMTPDEFIKTLEKQSLIRQKGDAEAIHHLEQEELRDNQEQDPTPEAPVRLSIFITFCVFKYPASSCLFKNGQLSSGYL